MEVGVGGFMAAGSKPEQHLCWTYSVFTFIVLPHHLPLTNRHVGLINPYLHHTHRKELKIHETA